MLFSLPRMRCRERTIGVVLHLEDLLKLQAFLVGSSSPAESDAARQRISEVLQSPTLLAWGQLRSGQSASGEDQFGRMVRWWEEQAISCLLHDQRREQESGMSREDSSVTVASEALQKQVWEFTYRYAVCLFGAGEATAAERPPIREVLSERYCRCAALAIQSSPCILLEPNGEEPERLAWLATLLGLTDQELESLRREFLAVEVPPLPDLHEGTRVDAQGKASAASRFAMTALRALDQPFECDPLLLSNTLRQLERNHRLESHFRQELQRAKMSAMKELAYGASHEINNPLANISTRAQTLLRDETDPERKERLAAINSQAFRAHEMISNMMLFAHPPDMHPVAIDVDQWLKESIEPFGSDLKKQQIVIQVVRDASLAVLLPSQSDSASEPCFSLNGDRDHLVVLLQALIRNAVEAIGREGVIELSAGVARQDPTANPQFASQSVGTEVEQDRFWLEVRDSGPGIPDAVMDHLFDPFFSGREAGRGLGFGLAKAWRIVELHGGLIEAKNGDKEGALFRIELPLIRSQ